jgi:LemA protein
MVGSKIPVYLYWAVTGGFCSYIMLMAARLKGSGALSPSALLSISANVLGVFILIYGIRYFYLNFSSINEAFQIYPTLKAFGVAARFILFIISAVLSAVLLVTFNKESAYFGHNTVFAGLLLISPLAFLLQLIIIRYMTYMKVTHAPEQMLSTFAMCAGVMFFMGMARLVSGVELTKGAKVCLGYGYVSSILFINLSIPYILAMIVGIIVGAVVFIIIIWFIASYNGFIKLRNSVDEAFSTMDVYLKKRYDLIPNLVETVKGYAQHEKETFEKVISARNMAASATTNWRKGSASRSRHAGAGCAPCASAVMSAPSGPRSTKRS